METKPSGSPEAGKAVFAAQGCGGCHTFAAAASSGTTGPNLDEVLSGKDAAFVRQSIVTPDAEIAQGFQPGVMPQTYGEQLSEQQLNALLEYLLESAGGGG